MKPISQDKREIIVAAKQRGEKVDAIALWVGVAPSSVYNILRLQRETASIEPKPYPGKTSVLTAEQLQQIRQAISEDNDITLEELIEKLDLPIKKSRLSVLLIGMGLSFKKRHFTPLNNNEKMSKGSVKTGAMGKKKLT